MAAARGGGVERHAGGGQPVGGGGEQRDGALGLAARAREPGVEQLRQRRRPRHALLGDLARVAGGGGEEAARLRRLRPARRLQRRARAQVRRLQPRELHH